MQRTILLLVVLLLAYAPFGLCAGKMLFLTGGISPPLVFEKNGRIIGMDVDTVSEFCKSQGITPEFKAYPLKRALAMMKTSEAQGIFTIFRNPEREEFLQFPETPINTVRTIIIGLRGNHIKIGRMDDLKNIKIGVVDGHKYGPLFDNYQGLNKYPVRDKSVLIRLLAAGDRVDAIINSEAVFKYECMEFGYDMKMFEKLYTVADNPVYLGFSKKALGEERAAGLAEKFSAFMKEMEENGKLQSLRERYEGQLSY